jgi:UDP-N-acetylmuramate: L-alanyl-gamma-D-glutamyl-meso-diaminopimelate ligase
MVYNEEDDIVKNVVENTKNTIKKYPYKTPKFRIENGITFIDTPEGEIPLEIFGIHNLQNMAGAKWICQHMGVGEDEFYEAISTFKGASKRLEKIAENDITVVFKDFAHSPSKVQAATDAVKNQYKNRKVLACLELHTYSSLNADFLKEYKGALEGADKAVVFYSPSAVKIKRLEKITEEQIRNSFEREDLIVYTDSAKFKEFLFNQNFENTALLLMSSGNYGGLDFNKFKQII